MSSSNALLELSRVEIAYGGIQAVKGIDLHVDKGELVCLIGTNGAGKTTTLKGITGLQPVKDGAIRYAGENVTGRPAFELVRKGLAMVPEGRGVFGALTIEENLAMGAYIRTDTAAIRDDVERVFALFPRLKERRRQTAGTLSGGEQQMLAIGRALMGNPSLLLLDEPLEGLAPVIVDALIAALHRLRQDDGLAVVLVEQHARLALEFATRAIVLDRGRVVYDDASQPLLDDAQRLAALIGVG